MAYRFVLDPARTLATLRILGRGPGEFERGICTELITSYNKGWMLKTPTLIQVAERMVIESQKHKNPTPTISVVGEERFYEIYQNLPDNEILSAVYAMFPAPHVPLATTYVGIAEVEERGRLAAAGAAPPPPRPHAAAAAAAYADEPPILDTNTTYQVMRRLYHNVVRAHGGGIVTDIIPEDVSEYCLTRGQKVFLIQVCDQINVAYMTGIDDPTTTKPTTLLAELIVQLYEECNRICRNQRSIFDPGATPIQLRDTLLCIVHIREICIAAGTREMCNNLFARTLSGFIRNVPNVT